MFKYSKLCECGSIYVPFILDKLASSKIIKHAYCPDCILNDNPNLGMHYPNHIIYGWDFVLENVPFVMNEKTIGIYAKELNGYFGVRYNIYAQETWELCVFDVPIKENYTRLPMCLKCENLYPVDFEKRDNQFYLKQKCKVFDTALNKNCFQCDKFKFRSNNGK